MPLSTRTSTVTGTASTPRRAAACKRTNIKRAEASGAVRLDVVNQGVDAFDVHLLDAVRVAIPRHPDFSMAQPGEGTAVFSGEPHDGTGPVSRAASAALTTLGEFPEVEMASRTSPLWPMAST